MGCARGFSWAAAYPQGAAASAAENHHGLLATHTSAPATS